MTLAERPISYKVLLVDDDDAFLRSDDRDP
jgi:hypothetical protein